MEQSLPFEPDPFRAAWWLPGAHAQTVAGRFLRPLDLMPLHRERIETADGDFLDLDFAPEPALSARNHPVVLLMHGLEGSARRGYAYVLVNIRGTGESEGIYQYLSETEAMDGHQQSHLHQAAAPPDTPSTPTEPSTDADPLADIANTRRATTSASRSDRSEGDDTLSEPPISPRPRMPTSVVHRGELIVRRLRPPQG